MTAAATRLTAAAEHAISRGRIDDAALERLLPLLRKGRDLSESCAERAGDGSRVAKRPLMNSNRRKHMGDGGVRAHYEAMGRLADIMRAMQANVETLNDSIRSLEALAPHLAVPEATSTQVQVAPRATEQSHADGHNRFDPDY